MRKHPFFFIAVVICFTQSPPLAKADEKTGPDLDNVTAPPAKVDTVPVLSSRIASALDKNLCLGHMQGSVTLVPNCTGGAAEWKWPPQTDLAQGPLRTGGVDVDVNLCLTEELTLVSCEATTAVWTYSRNTSQIHLGPASPLGQCLTLAMGSPPNLQRLECAIDGDANMPGQSWIIETNAKPFNLFQCRDVNCAKAWGTAFVAQSKVEFQKMTKWQQAGVALLALSLVCCFGVGLTSCCCKGRKKPPPPPPPPPEPRSMFDCTGANKPARTFWCCTRSPPPSNINGAYRGLISNER